MKRLRIALYAGIVGVGLLIASFILPPTGAVDPSVIKAVGMTFTFGAFVDALYSNKIIKATHKDTEIYIGDKENIEQ